LIAVVLRLKYRLVSVTKGRHFRLQTRRKRSLSSTVVIVPPLVVNRPLGLRSPANLAFGANTPFAVHATASSS
jgi:hypothetical protein